MKSGLNEKKSEKINGKKRPLRIAHIVSSLNVGGMEQFVARLAEHQHRDGHTVCIFTLHDGPLRETASAGGVAVQLIGGNYRFTRSVHTLLRFRNFQPDIIHAHNTTSLHFAALGRLSSRAKLIITYHGRGKGIPRRLSAWERYLTTAAVTVSHAVVDQAEKDFAGKVSVIRNGIAPSEPKRPRNEVRAALGLGENVAAICVARMDALKGHKTLLDALAILKKQEQRLTVLLVGDGAERAALEQQASALGLDTSCLRFLGFRQDITDLLAASDLFVLPSLSEGLPLSVLEAMSQGIPIVASCVGGIPEVVIEGENGLLVPPNDSEALAEAMTTLLTDPKRRTMMGQAGQTRVRSEFSFTGMAERYASLYTSFFPKHSQI